MTRRLLVVVIAVVGVVVVIAAGIIGVRVYSDAAKAASPAAPRPAVLSAATEAAYRSTVQSWPFALPVGQALPTKPPSEEVPGLDSVRPFVSFFFVCAWEHSYLDGPADGRELALTNLMLWERLPASISNADNSDGVWTHDIIDPAINGDDAAMMRQYRAGCAGDSYADVVTTPGRGLTIDSPQAAVVSPTEIANPCASYPVAAPCDPAFGPNRAVDLGSRTGARGTVTLDAAGVPRSYLVAAGDTATAVADRFGDPNLWALNCYRRSDMTLYVGDVLYLDIYTVKTVGSENGSTVSKYPQTAASCLTQTAIPPHQVAP